MLAFRTPRTNRILTHVPRAAAGRSTHTMGNSRAGADLEPLVDNILVCLQEAEERSIGGLILPEGSVARSGTYSQGSVVSVGPGGGPEGGPSATARVDVDPGDFVIFPANEGVRLRLDGAAFSIVPGSKVLLRFSGDSSTGDLAKCVGDVVLLRPNIIRESKNLENGSFQHNRFGTEIGEAVVIAVGPTVSLDSLPKGSIVQYLKRDSKEILIAKEKFLLVKANEILLKKRRIGMGD